MPRFVRYILLLSLLVCLPSFAVLRLPSVLSDNMVLQHNSAVPIWGWAEPFQRVDVKGSWMVLATSTRANADGKWSTKIKSPQAGEGYSIVIQSGKEFLELRNVLSGEVWVCAGATNMQMPLNQANDWEREKLVSNLPQVRLFTVEQAFSQSPLEDTKASWFAASPETVADFSAIGYHYAKLLHNELQVPIGIIQATWQDTLAESWMTKEALLSDKDFAPILDSFGRRILDYPRLFTQYQAQFEQWQQLDSDDKGEAPAEPALTDENSPSSLYNGMISPIIPYRIKGVLWYQGEENRLRAWQYRKLFPALIEDWRKNWNQGSFPFYFAQIAPFEYTDEQENLAAELREAQLLTMQTVINTGMVATTDIGEVDNIAFGNKSVVANRLFLWAMAKDYGRRNTVYSGPIYESMVVERDKIRIMFEHLGQGLMVTGFQAMRHFEIAGEDKVFYPAKGVIERNTVLLSSEDVPFPVAARFAWENAPQPNLFNRQGLPAVPFRTDDW